MMVVIAVRKALIFLNHFLNHLKKMIKREKRIFTKSIVFNLQDH